MATMEMNRKATEIPYGYCKCGCGDKTPIAKRNYAYLGHRKGEPISYIQGHQNASPWNAFIEYCEYKGEKCGVFRISNGRHMIVSAEDVERLPRFITYGGEGYATCRVNGKLMGVHRFLMGAPKGMDVDHINHNILDNRRSNLRVCTRQQNMWNKNKNLNRVHRSDYKGVMWHGATDKWYVSVRDENERLITKFFDEEVDAAKFYDSVIKRARGEFAVLNFPEGSEIEATKENTRT